MADADTETASGPSGDGSDAEASSLTPRERQGWTVLALATAVVVAFYALGGAYQGWALQLGSIREPTQTHLHFLFYFAPFAIVFVGLMAVGIVRAFHADPWWDGWEDARFLPRAVGVGLLVPVALRLLVLGGMPIADDESLYRFGAELLAQGQLTGTSHPARLFFDHAFLVNDGAMFSQYFLGWPAFLSLGVLVGVPGFVNAVLSAATVPPLYWLARETAGRIWAQVVVALFLLSPMLQLLAATELSHTSALFALTWVAWLAWRAVHAPDEALPAAGLGLAFSVAFFIRPLTALGIGLPFLGWWALRWWRDGRKPLPAAAFLAPTLVLAVLFLAVNRLQTGSALQPAYMAWQEFARANAFRFSGLDPGGAPTVPNLVIAGLDAALRTLSLGMVRLNYALFGWPTAFLFLPLAVGAAAWRKGASWVFWASIGLFLLLHAPLKDAGIDTVGPVHFTELALPVLILTGVGMARLARWWQERVGDGDEALPEGRAPGRAGQRAVLAVVAGLVVGNVVLYAPQRLEAVSGIGTLVSVPFQALESTGVENAVVFSSVPWAYPCNPALEAPSRPFVFWWPVNEPGLTDDIIHANHLSIEADRALMAESFPDRQGWIFHWNPNCTLVLLPLDAPEAEEIPNGVMSGGISGPARWDPSHPPSGEVPEGFGR